jgi:hypothetical protein
MRSLLCAAAFVFGAQFGESALPAEATHQESPGFTGLAVPRCSLVGLSRDLPRG